MAGHGPLDQEAGQRPAPIPCLSRRASATTHPSPAAARCAPSTRYSTLATAVSAARREPAATCAVGIGLDLADHRRIQRAVGQARVIAAARGRVDLRCRPARDARRRSRTRGPDAAPATVRDHAGAVGRTRLVGQRQLERALRQRLVLASTTAARSSSSFTSGVFSACAAACSWSQVAASAWRATTRQDGLAQRRRHRRRIAWPAPRSDDALRRSPCSSPSAPSVSISCVRRIVDRIGLARLRVPADAREHRRQLRDRELAEAAPGAAASPR